MKTHTAAVRLAIGLITLGFVTMLGVISCLFFNIQPVFAITRHKSAAMVDATATAAAATVAAALSATPSPTTLATPKQGATQTAIVNRLATAVAATLTAQPTATPNVAATQTAKANQLATAVAATLTARPTATLNVAATQTARANARQTAIAATLTALPPPTLPATPTHPSSTATRAPETVVLPMILIPAGEFVMGSSDADLELTLQECNQSEGNCQADWFASERPAHTVFVDQFSISQYEVTNAQYNICVAQRVCPKIGRLPADADIPYKTSFFGSALPAVAVSWDNANRFCQWIGTRLPSEAEWEKAARGADGSRRYPWGYTFETGRANLAADGPKPVGSYPSGASPYGVMDMAGNVFEWTATAMDDGRYVVRGGSWSKFAFRGRVTDRGTKLQPNFVNYDIGFRCAK